MQGNLTKLWFFFLLMELFILVFLLCRVQSTCWTRYWLTKCWLCTQIRVLLDLVYSAWKGSMNEFALVTQVQRVTGHNSSRQMNGFDKLWQHNLAFPASSLIRPRLTAPPRFHAFQQKAAEDSLAGSDSGFLWSVPFKVNSKSFALLRKKTVSWQINADGEPGDYLWPSEEGSGLDHALRQPWEEEALPGFPTTGHPFFSRQMQDLDRWGEE